MTLPLGFPSPGPNKVCKLIKSLYGLKQASRKWFEKLSLVLLQCGYRQANADHTLFLKSDSSSFTALLVYVDDIILVGNSLSEFASIKRVLDDRFKIKDLRLLRYFLGLEVANSAHEISLCQRKYCLELLQDSGLTTSKPASTPLDPTIHLHQDDGQSFSDIPAYHRLVGRLLYLTTTRPDIAFATQQVSQLMASPTMQHFKAVMRVVRYLKASLGRGLFFSCSSEVQILGFSDADWGGAMQTPASLSVDTASSLAIPSFRGNLRSKEQCHDLLQKLSIVHWPLPPVSFNGQSICQLISIFSSLALLFYTVIVRVRSTLPPIQSSMSELSTQTLIVTLFARSLNLVLCDCFQFPLVISVQTSSLRLCLLNLLFPSYPSLD